MSAITILDEDDEARDEEVQVSDIKLPPPNLVWRLTIAMQHAEVRMAGSRGTGQSSIVLFCPLKDCPYGHQIPYIDFQHIIYNRLSDLSDRYIDHLGTFYIRENKLMIEVHFSSSDQIKKCIDGLETMVLTKSLSNSLCTFVKQLEGVEFDATLVIYSNLDSRLRIVTRENAAYAFQIAYTDKPAVTLLHIHNPEIYGPIKSAYNQLLAAFPDFLGEVGAIDFAPEDRQSEVILMDASTGEVTSVDETHEALKKVALESIGDQVTIPIQGRDSNGVQTTNDFKTSEGVIASTSESSPIEVSNSPSAQNEASPLETTLTGSEADSFMQAELFKPSSDDTKPHQSCEETVPVSKFVDKSSSQSCSRFTEPSTDVAAVPKETGKDTVQSYKDRNKREAQDEDICPLVVGSLHTQPADNSSTGEDTNKQPSSSIHEFAEDKSVEQDTGNGTKSELKKFPNHTNASDMETLTDRELGDIADLIPPDKYEKLGLHLNLTYAQIKRIKHDAHNSFQCILEILVEANKRIYTTRQSLFLALVQCGLPKVAKKVDPSVDLTTLEHSQFPLTISENTVTSEGEGLCLVDGKLKFYDKQLAREHVEKQQPLSFWAKLHKELTKVVNEALQYYGIQPHLVTEGSLIVHIRFVSPYQAYWLSTDIASGKLINMVETKMKALGFTGILAILFEIDSKEVTQQRCYKIYLQALLLKQLQKETSDGWRLSLRKTTTPSKANMPLLPKRQHEAVDSAVLTGTGDTSKEPSTPKQRYLVSQFESLATTSRKDTLPTSENHSLFEIIRFGNSEQLVDALNKNADITQYQNGFLAIHTAAHYGKSVMIRILVKHGAVVSATTTTKQQLTALHLAAYSGHLKAAQTLVELQANVEASSADGCTPLRLAAGQGNILVVKYLLSQKVNCNSQCKLGVTPLHAAISKGSQAVVKMLLRHGANVTLSTNDGETPIHHALVVKNAEILKLLVSDNPQVINHPSVTKLEPPIVTACKLQSSNLVKYLLECKANPNLPNRDDMTPLAIASSLESLEIMELLVKHGADMTQDVPPRGTALHIAATEGKVNATRKLLKMGMNPDTVDSEGTTPLRRAVECQKTDVATLLLKAGASITAECPGDELPLLHKAAKRNDVKMLQILINNGADPFLRAKRGGTALLIAAVNNSVDVIDTLSTKPGLINIPNRVGVTPLIAAIVQRKYESALQLLKHKPDVSISDSQGMAPLYICVDYRAPEEVVREILVCGAKIDSPGPNGITPIALACRRGFTELVKAMLEVNPNFLKCSPQLARSLVFSAITAGSSGTLEALLQYGADPNVVDSSRQVTPLHAACRDGFTKMFHILLNHNADVNFVTSLGAPLHVAVAMGRNEYVHALLCNKANPDITSGPEQATPLIIAAETNQIEAAKLLLRYGARVDYALVTNGYTALHKAASSNFVDMANLLIENEATVDRPSKQGFTPFHMAISAGSKEVFALLVENSCNINAQDNEGVTPLMRAIHDQKPEIALMLIELGADIHKCGSSGLHALHFGAQVNAPDVVSRLLDLGADRDIQERNGVTPLIIAVALGHLDIAKSLLSKGASTDISDHQKQTPLHVAAADNNADAVTLLLQHNANPTLHNVNSKTPADLTKSKNIQKAILSAQKTASLKPIPQSTSMKVEDVAYRLRGVSQLSSIAAELGISQNEWQNIEHTHSEATRRILATLHLWQRKKHAMSEDDMQIALQELLQKFNV